MSATSRYGLPLILPGQAQKELFHNEALAILDAAVNPAVEAAPLALPPATPEPGQAWIVASLASGAWQGEDGRLAVWTEGGWRFVDATPGMIAWSKADAVWLHFDGAAWSSGEIPATAIRIGGNQVVGARQPAVPSPSGGTIIDEEARAAIDALIATLMSHGLID